MRNLACSILFGLFLFTGVSAQAQDTQDIQYLQRFNTGKQLYNEGRFSDSAAHFRFAQEIAVTMDDRAQALYWVILTELALSDYSSALLDMDELERASPDSVFTIDMNYHRARIYFNLGYFEDALFFFRRYIDTIAASSFASDSETEDRKAAAFFWMGECLYYMGQFDEAENFYSWVVTMFPASPRVSVSGYRIDLIKQKKIEAELLALLRWSHEESIRTSEDYQRRIRTYEHTLNVYQRRIAELTHGNILAAEEIDIEVPVQVEEIIEETTLPVILIEDKNGEVEDLIEWARQLQFDIQTLLREYEFNAGGL